jgi:methionyl-tRNA formyltransferase
LTKPNIWKKSRRKKQQMENNKNIAWAFFGTSRFSTLVLDELASRGLVPRLIITAEDKPKGRKLVLTPPEAKAWAEKNGVSFIQLKSLRDPEVVKTIASYSPEGFDVFVVASYGKILPQAILDMPRHQTLNVHPSLLPKLRGASPIQSAILSENSTGVTIMRLDAEMDHGPLLAQQEVPMPEWPPYADEAETLLAQAGGALLADVLPRWIAGEISETEQNHSQATSCSKIAKADGLLDLSASADLNLRKIRAYHAWPGAHFMHEKNGVSMRVIVKRAHMENDALVIERVVPEGRKEMDYLDFLRGVSKVIS